MRRTSLLLLIGAAILLFPAVAFADGGGGSFEEAEAKGLIWMYLASFGAGFLTSLTPCVYPMIPITLGIFGARGKDVSKGRALLLATAYVIGMGVTYSVLGVTVTLTVGATAFGSQLSHPAIVIPLVLLFIVMAASMLGAFNLELPQSVQNRLNQVGGKGFGGAFAMGLVGGLVAAPCTGPFLASLLAFVSTTGSVVTGGSLLFVYALGMGVLFWALAAFALALPKSGAWMDAVKSVLGVGILIAALYFLRPLFPWMRTWASPEKWFLAVSLGVVAAGIAVGGIHLSFHSTRQHQIRKAIGIVLLLAGAFGVYTWKLTPKQRLPWVHDEQAAFAEAARSGKGVMVDFGASWCTPCEELELTFGDDDVYDAITSSFVTLKLDVTDGTDEQLEARSRYGAKTLPHVVWLDATRLPLERLDHLVEPDDILPLIKSAAKRVRPASSSSASR